MFEFDDNDNISSQLHSHSWYNTGFKSLTHQLLFSTLWLWVAISWWLFSFSFTFLCLCLCLPQPQFQNDNNNSIFISWSGIFCSNMQWSICKMSSNSIWLTQSMVGSHFLLGFTHTSLTYHLPPTRFTWTLEAKLHRLLTSARRVGCCAKGGGGTTDSGWTQMVVVIAGGYNLAPVIYQHDGRCEWWWLLN
jgi:hypothetical protein